LLKVKARFCDQVRFVLFTSEYTGRILQVQQRPVKTDIRFAVSVLPMPFTA